MRKVIFTASKNNTTCASQGADLAHMANLHDEKKVAIQLGYLCSMILSSSALPELQRLPVPTPKNK